VEQVVCVGAIAGSVCARDFTSHLGLNCQECELFDVRPVRLKARTKARRGLEVPEIRIEVSAEPGNGVSLEGPVRCDPEVGKSRPSAHVIADEYRLRDRSRCFRIEVNRRCRRSDESLLGLRPVSTMLPKYARRRDSSSRLATAQASRTFVLSIWRPLQRASPWINARAVPDAISDTIAVLSCCAFCRSSHWRVNAGISHALSAIPISVTNSAVGARRRSGCFFSAATPAAAGAALSIQRG